MHPLRNKLPNKELWDSNSLEFYIGCFKRNIIFFILSIKRIKNFLNDEKYLKKKKEQKYFKCNSNKGILQIITFYTKMSKKRKWNQTNSKEFLFLIGLSEMVNAIFSDVR